MRIAIAADHGSFDLLSLTPCQFHLTPRRETLCQIAQK
jgi:hypothetical protein